jgi:hypothetical protein
MALVRATALQNFLVTALSTTAASTAPSTWAVASGQRVIGALHLTGISTGRTFVGSVQSASSSGFGAITSELQFALTSVVGSTWKTLTGASTDRPWRRAAWTLSTAASTAGTWTGMIWAGYR